MNKAPETALITGASAGIGAIYADRLAQRGWNLILVARNRDRLNQVAASIRLKSGVSVETMSVDLTGRAGQQEIADRLIADPRIGMLVNNAGFGSTAPIAQADPDVMADMIALNVGAVARLAGAAASVFLSRGQGAIINIASIVAIAPETLNGVYGGTKAFVLALSQALRHELAPKGIRVQVVLPGATATDFWRLSGTPVDALPKAIVMSADDVVDSALAGFDQGEFVTIPSLPDEGDWEAFESARQALVPNLSHASPAARYARV
ncbi:SDR family NAD(P)-dependent oxidoreductase [Sphingomonas sp. MAH-20]|uniref:NADP-dependent 3-hydroxy acid dehydrogenase YdfG n=1 Tax=Sphingomonas horti TaxID=2682842 RepID=A0A6I4J285_9SPHN|nr:MULTISPECIES: SDR family oxidoreductase [Sphingomonas]MBA2920665.1 SDR family oxidoreductase [Sphingomonas sp. CGMCC 1.13658]MVO77601.1 SDR family NAD(P)-dependent oxidoreductase [Sphingomonas horti]